GGEVLNSAAQTIAEYVYLDALTPAQSFFDQCRRESSDPQAASAPLRTFTLHRIAAASEEAIDQAAATLSCEVVMRWAGNDAAPAKETGSATSAPAAPSVRDTNQMVQGA